MREKDTIPAFAYEGKHIAVLEYNALETWDDLDNIVAEGWDIVGITTGGFLSGSVAIIFKRNKAD